MISPLHLIVSSITTLTILVLVLLLSVLLLLVALVAVGGALFVQLVVVFLSLMMVSIIIFVVVSASAALSLLFLLLGLFHDFLRNVSLSLEFLIFLVVFLPSRFSVFKHVLDKQLNTETVLRFFFGNVSKLSKFSIDSFKLRT